MSSIWKDWFFVTPAAAFLGALALWLFGSGNWPTLGVLVAGTIALTAIALATVEGLGVLAACYDRAVPRNWLTRTLPAILLLGYLAGLLAMEDLALRKLIIFSSFGAGTVVCFVAGVVALARGTAPSQLECRPQPEPEYYI